jgi:hypothetical protein
MKKIKPIVSYYNAYLQRKEIFKDNRNKVGIYMWTNLISKKCYVGSSINISRRIRDYFNKLFLKSELEKNNSLIYKALLKYNYDNFRLDILEYCDPKLIFKREQYYLDNLKLEYNTLKFAGSRLGCKHNTLSKQRISAAKLGKPCSEITKLKLSINSSRSVNLIVKNERTGVTNSFISIKAAADFINIHPSGISRNLTKNNYYRGKGYFVVKKVNLNFE